MTNDNETQTNEVPEDQPLTSTNTFEYEDEHENPPAVEEDRVRKPAPSGLDTTDTLANGEGADEDIQPDHNS